MFKYENSLICTVPLSYKQENNGLDVYNIHFNSMYMHAVSLYHHVDIHMSNVLKFNFSSKHRSFEQNSVTCHKNPLN